MTPPDRRAARALQLLLGIGISAVLVIFAFRKVDPAAVWTAIRSARVAPLLLAVVLATASFPIRVPRWRLLLRREDGSALPVRVLWHPIAIGFAANNVLLFRAGELLRVLAVSRLAPVPFATALSSVAVERILDGLTIVGLFGAGLVAAQFPPGTMIGTHHLNTLASGTGVICLVALLAGVAASHWPEVTLGVVRAITPAGAVRARLEGFADRVLRGLAALGDPRHALPVVGWSVLLWVVNATAFWVAFRAFGLHIPFSGAFVLQGVLAVGIALPSTPGYFGLFETMIWLTLALYGVPKETALAFALAYHITTFIPITLLGAMSAVQTRMGFGRGRAVPA